MDFITKGEVEKTFWESASVRRKLPNKEIIDMGRIYFFCY